MPAIWPQYFLTNEDDVGNSKRRNDIIPNIMNRKRFLAGLLTGIIALPLGSMSGPVYAQSLEETATAISRRIDGGKPGSNPQLPPQETNAPSAASPSAAWSFVGAGPNYQVGWTLRKLGDFDGDGAEDFMVGNPGVPFEAVSGEVLIISGKDFAVLKTFRGSQREDFGYAVAALGDANKDGYPDFVAGIPARADGDAPKDSGEFRIYLSRYKDGLVQYVARSVKGRRSAGYLGRSLVPIAARNFFVATEPSFTGGTAYAFNAITGEREYEIEKHPLDFSGENERKGYLAWPASDMDGDGVTDFVLGAPGQSPENDMNSAYPGRLYFYSGKGGKLLCILEGEDPSSHLGMSFSAQPAQFYIGAPYQTQGQNLRAGAAYLVDPARLCKPGKPEVLKIAPSSDFVVRREAGHARNELLGFGLAALTDLDGDSVADYAQSAPGFAGYKGRVQILSGNDGSQIYSIDGGTSNSWFGTQLAALDSGARLLVGSPFFSGQNTMSGRVDLYNLTLTSKPQDKTNLSGK